MSYKDQVDDGDSGGKDGGRAVLSFTGPLLVGLQKLNKNIKSLFNMTYLILIKNYVHLTE